MDEREKITDYAPGALGSLIALHAKTYGVDSVLGQTAELAVAEEVVAFFRRFDAAYDGIWVAAQQDRITGAIALDSLGRVGDLGQLRWFLVAADAPDPRGLARRLHDAATEFARVLGHRGLYIDMPAAFEGMGKTMARFDYEIAGEATSSRWGFTMLWRRYQRRFG